MWMCSRPIPTTTRSRGTKNLEGSGGSFSEHVVTTSADYAHSIFGIDLADSAQSVFAIDTDGDGDVGVLSASVTESKAAWDENLGRYLNKRE